MIRERVDVKGFTRPMEPEVEIPALQLKPHEIGLIREEPAIRWHEGQKKWDKRYRKRAHKVVQNRKRMEARAAELIERAKAQGLEFQVNDRPSHVRQDSGASRASVRTTDGVIQEDRRWGPLDLDEENPPPSAIAGRRDTVSRYSIQCSLMILNSCSMNHSRCSARPSTTPRRKPTQQSRE